MKHIPLPDISFDMTRNLHTIIQKALFSNGICSVADNDILQAHLQLIRKGMQIPDAGHTPEDLFEAVLQELWFNVVRPVICDLNLKVGCFYTLFAILVLTYFFDISEVCQ